MKAMEYEIISSPDKKDIARLESRERMDINLGGSLCATFKKIKGISDAYSITLVNKLTHNIPYYQSIGTVEELEEFVVSYIINGSEWEKLK
jgi:hypothetical protein